MIPNRLVTAIIALSISASISVFAQDASTYPSWTSKDGRAIQAKFVKLDGEAVVIEKNGKQLSLSFAKLDAASIEQARKLASGATMPGLIAVPHEGAGRLVVEPLSEGGKPSSIGLIAMPDEVTQATNVVRVSVSGHHALALSSDGRVFSWGRKAEDLAALPPAMLGMEKKVVQIIAGRPDAVLLEDGTVQLADGAKLNIPEGIFIKRIEGCPPFLYAFDASGHITYIGPKQSAATMNVPAEIAAVPVRDLVGTAENALAVTDKGNLLVWGSNAGGLPSLPDELTQQISKGNTVTVATISGACGMAIVKSGKTTFWGTEKQWFGAGVADVNNALNITLLAEGYWAAFVIQRLKGGAKGYEFYAKGTERNAYLTKVLKRHNPSALAGGTGAMVMIVPSARK